MTGVMSSIFIAARNSVASWEKEKKKATDSLVCIVVGCENVGHEICLISAAVKIQALL